MNYICITTIVKVHNESVSGLDVYKISPMFIIHSQVVCHRRTVECLLNCVVIQVFNQFFYSLQITSIFIALTKNDNTLNILHKMF